MRGFAGLTLNAPDEHVADLLRANAVMITPR